ncbi:lysylphosphatidylglycerol synthase domain-containing protein [Pararhodobacter sp. CCB-MM2]|uniref:lysylphosphatidylglycerol synthase domain-containing protein n=1 Tax=Pararhodobacter sp. CCB-MM2 TaxID=1786003 RepID=UPI00083741FA|nr:lysylphosphatidylglycerol synthase domain-containing protein [Pararhodobacter sp. CCB-MM2]
MPRPILFALKRYGPIVLAGVLFAMGIYALVHLLRPVNPADIMAQIKAMPLSTLALALGATAIGYAALVCYDWYGLRFIRRRLPGGVIALGGFLAFAFGNTIGVSAISGGAVRYRLYSAMGLTGIEVAAVSAYVAVALGTGLTLVGLAALAIHPHAIAAYLPYAPETVRMVAGGLLLLSLGAILTASIRQSNLRLFRVTLHMPPPRDLAGQVVVTLIDIAMASFALWILLPAGKPDFATFLAVYSAAIMIGVLSHVPGGVGVFETVVLGVMPASVAVSDAAAALLLFRLIYYLVPFILGFVLVALTEARAISRIARRLLPRAPEPMQPALSALHGLAPALVAAVACGFGLYLGLVSLIPALRSDALAEGDLAGMILSEGGALTSGLTGLALIALSFGLVRRLRAAFLASVGLLLWGSGLALVDGFDVENALFLGLGALLLLPFRSAFDQPASRGKATDVPLD